MRQLCVLILLLLPTSAFGQTPQEMYQAAKAAEFRSDNAANQNERGAYISEAFELISRAVALDVRYIDTFSVITRKYIARGTGTYSYFSMVPEIVNIGEIRGGHPVFKALASEVATGYQKHLLQRGFAPGRALVQTRRDRFHCNVPNAAENIFGLLRLARPGSAETNTWGRYAGDVHMAKLRGCGGEGSDIDGDIFKAFPLYLAAKHHPGIQKVGKMLGDHMMEMYIFGGYANAGDHVEAGYRRSFEDAMLHYRAAGTTRNEIRATILRNLRKAETNRDQKAIELAKKTLSETF